MSKSGEKAASHADDRPKDDETFQKMKGAKSASSEMRKSLMSNPLVPIGALMVIASLGAGLKSMAGGDRHGSQNMMRWRVGSQFFLLSALVFGGMYTVWKPRLFPDKSDDEKH